MNGGRAQQARCDERAARDLREREWRAARADTDAYALAHKAELDAEWDALDGRTTSQKVRDDIAAMTPGEWARLNALWENG
ncbi:MAG: hypothetical protein GOVbin7759_20 [Prokaryotic dsDNA virus sp.]|jgi:hypothetical protein|nr:MAG: hypothetical protein GOVbin7759_20 [Prokaryotic dsDNA virus sp.]